MAFIWTRLFYVYGPSQQPKALIPHIIRCAKDHKQPNIRNPKAKNDFIYVEDVADALCAILKKCNESNTYNIGSGKLTSVSYIMNYIFDRLHIKKDFKKVQSQSKDAAFNYAFADISKIKKEIGWEPKISVEEGILKTIASQLNTVNQTFQ